MDMRSLSKIIKQAEEVATVIRAATEPERLTVERIDNHIYFYAGVDTDRCLALIREIRATDSHLRHERISHDLPDDHPKTPIWLHINSSGGDVFAGLAVMDMLSKISTPIHSIVEGHAASAATLISMACDKRYILPNSFMLIHQVSSAKWGTYAEFEDDMKLQRMLMDRLSAFYVSHSNITKEEVKALLGRDSWFDAKQARKRGLVDDIL